MSRTVGYFGISYEPHPLYSRSRFYYFGTIFIKNKLGFCLDLTATGRIAIYCGTDMLLALDKRGNRLC